MHSIRFLFLTLIVLLASCSTQVKNNYEHQKLNVSIEKKELNRSSQRGIVPIDDKHIFSVKTWYSDDEVLYLSGKGSMFGSQLIRYNIMNGNNEVFFETSHSIIQVSASRERNFFAIESKDIQNNSIVSIIDKHGELLYEKKQPVDLVEFAWNPYNDEKLMVTYYLPTFDTNIQIIDLYNISHVVIVDAIPFVQWFCSNKIAYFHWDENTSLTAPIEIMDLHNNKIKDLESNALAFSSIEDYFMYVEEEEGTLIFTFLKSETEEEVSSFKIPLIDSHAGFVWTPSFYWDQDSKVFYTYEPFEAGSILDYNQDFNLIAFNVETGEKDTLLQTETISQIECSNNRGLCLVGDRLESIIEIDSGTITALFSTENE